MSSSPSWSLHDPVWVPASSGDGTLLEGVLAHLGPVPPTALPPGAAPEETWVGVRLTGNSVGLGVHDGTCGGHFYFACPPHSGLWVPARQVQARTLTRLEELRLRRELATTSGSSSSTSTSAAATAATPAAASTPRSAAAEDLQHASSSEETTSTTMRTKLEELRQRRAALQQQQDRSTATSTEATSASPPPERSPSNADLLRQEQAKVSMLQEQWQQAQQELRQAQQELKRAQQELSQASRATEASSSPPPESQQQQQEWQLRLEDVQDQLRQAREDLQQGRLEAEQERRTLAERTDQLTQCRAQVTALTQELHTLADQSAQRGQADASHYKERAKLTADLSALRRRVEQLEREKVDLESTLEDLTLDKEQLQEEKEQLEDRLEELKLDAESAQVEAEELRLQLEDAQASTERASNGLYEDSGGSVPAGQAEDMAQALSVQNARLREALVRLREQMSVEKMDMARQLRVAEKEAETGRSLVAEVESLRALQSNLEEQINDLKDMVEQGSAFEAMVEDLSDRVLSLEEDNVALRGTIRELEEASELTAEMEEVQADEIKSMARDLEGRDTIIRNLEEAIKIQRRREDDFRRTVGNYRTTVETLRQERQALLELQQGGEGEKSHLIASSQKALARAAQLVSDAADMRKREAQAVMDKIESETSRHLAVRLESLLPGNVAAGEIAAIKGELLVCRMVGKASSTLQGIALSYSKIIKPALDEPSLQGSPSDVKLSDDVEQQVKAVLHQTDFAQVVVDAAADMIRLLAAGQWPDLLSPESSSELGSIMGHSIGELDNMFGNVLKSLKEEGLLTEDQSNIGAFKQIVESTRLRLTAEMERTEGTLVPPDWNPPSWQLIRDASYAKFSCLGAVAAMSAVINDSDVGTVPSSLRRLYAQAEQCSSLSSTICLRVANVDSKSEKLLSDLGGALVRLRECSSALVLSVGAALLTRAGLDGLDRSIDLTQKELSAVSAILRAAGVNPNEDGRFHALSAESQDIWSRVSNLARSVRSIDGDRDDVNYLVRALAIEHRLADAVEKEPKLSLANAKVSSLEKALASRSKEIALQNARLTELERLVAKSSIASVGLGRVSDLKSSEEFNTLKEENRVLSEAMDVLQRQVDEYENEIRALKDFKSPKRGTPAARTTRRSTTTISDYGGPSGVAADEMQSSSGILEAAVFRPALQNAVNEAARWKADSVATAMEGLVPLPPLHLYKPKSDDETKESDDLFTQLESALMTCRLERASVRIVDLANTEKSPRLQLLETIARNKAANDRVTSIALRIRGLASEL